MPTVSMKNHELDSTSESWETLIKDFVFNFWTISTNWQEPGLSQPGVYSFWKLSGDQPSINDCCCYVGTSKNISARLRSYRYNKNKCFYRSNEYYIRWIGIHAREIRVWAERLAIGLCRPNANYTTVSMNACLPFSAIPLGPTFPITVAHLRGVYMQRFSRVARYRDIPPRSIVLAMTRCWPRRPSKRVLAVVSKSADPYIQSDSAVWSRVSGWPSLEEIELRWAPWIDINRPVRFEIDLANALFEPVLLDVK